MAMKNHAARKHSKFAASSAKRWMICPASVSLCEKCPPSPDNPASIAGTKSHEKLEAAWLAYRKTGVVEKKKLNADEYRALLALIHLAGNYSEHHCEIKVSLAHIHTDAFGTLDYAFFSPYDELCVIDYKTGRHTVTPREEDGSPNPQLAYYALALAHQYDWAFERVRLIILQPPSHQEVKGDHPYFEATYTLAEMRKFQSQVEAAIKAALEKNPPAIVTDEGCKFCPAKDICPARQEEGDTLEQKGSLALETLSSMDKRLERLSASDLGRVKTACETLTVYISQIEAKILELAAEGKDVAGFRYQARQARRKWVDAEEAAREARKLFGKKAFEEYLIGIPALEKLDKDFVAEYTTKESSGFVLKKIGARDNSEFFSAL